MSKHKKEASNNANKGRKPAISAIALFEKVVESAKKEVTTPYGKINLFFDIIMAAIVLVLFLSSSVAQIALFVCTIFNHDLIVYLNRKDTLIAFCIFVGFSIACIVFVFFSEKYIQKD